jgi:uncharacterized repeat protein (TIGR01451 family)
MHPIGIRSALPRLLMAFVLLAATLVAALAGAPARAACSIGACVTAGPRLASVDTQQAALLNPLLGGLLGSSLNLGVADWNTLAQGDVKVLGFLNALQATTNTSTPAQALNANVSIAQVAAALGTAANAEARTSLSGVLNALASSLAGSGATVRVGDLFKLNVDSGALAGSTLNALDMLTGLIQLYNYKNVLTTPQPVGISGGALGQAGLVNNLQLYAQVIEPPVYTCGPAGTQFHSAAIRLKLKLDLVTLTPVTSTLTAVPGVTSASVAISRLDVYLETARGEGSLAAIDAAAKAVTLQVAPGVADAYVGSIADSVFFNRTRTLSAADVDYGQIGTLVLNGVNVALEVKSTARGQAPFASSVTLTGTFPQSRTVSTSAAFVTGLGNSLVSNLALRTTILSTGLSGLVLAPVASLLGGALQPVLKTLVVNTLSPVLTQVLTGIADPLLKLLGIGLGQMTVSVTGICQACDDFKLTKGVDKTDALPGGLITYTITYQNVGQTTLSDLKVQDATPAFTLYKAGACGTLGAGLAGCTLGTQPAAGATGALVWSFNGSLAPGASGSVTFTVTVQ